MCCVTYHAGKAGALGSCALSSDAEYDPSGRRYDATVSRFATVIDLHDTLVYCAPKAHYCKFTKLTYPVSEVTVRVDAPSYLLAGGRLNSGYCLLTTYQCIRTYCTHAHSPHPPPWPGHQSPGCLLMVYQCTGDETH
jgi:hypothetical protein